MVERAASGGTLDGYHEMGVKLAETEHLLLAETEAKYDMKKQLDEARAEIAERDEFESGASDTMDAVIAKLESELLEVRARVAAVVKETLDVCGYDWEQLGDDDKERLARPEDTDALERVRAEEREWWAKVAEYLNGWGSDCGRGGHAMHITREDKT